MTTTNLTTTLAGENREEWEAISLNEVHTLWLATQHGRVLLASGGLHVCALLHLEVITRSSPPAHSSKSMTEEVKGSHQIPVSDGTGLNADPRSLPGANTEPPVWLRGRNINLFPFLRQIKATIYKLQSSRKNLVPDIL